MPLSGNLATINLADNMTYAQNRSLNSESATVGLFSTTLQNGVKIEITSGNHTGFMRYTFPGAGEFPSNGSATNVYPPTARAHKTNEHDAHVLVDLTHVIPAYTAMAYSQRYVRGDLHIRTSSNGSPSYFGSATYTGGWPQPDSHTIHFCGNFSVPASSVLTPTSDYVQPGDRSIVPSAGTFSWQYNPFMPPSFTARPKPRGYSDLRSYSGSGMGLGALFSWSPTEERVNGSLILEAKLGISYISAAQACSHVEHELPDVKSFEDVVEQGRREWEDKVLSKIQIGDDDDATSNNVTLKRMLYSALYQTSLMPTDKTGECPIWESYDGKPYYDDHYVSSCFATRWSGSDCHRRCGTHTGHCYLCTISSSPNRTPAFYPDSSPSSPKKDSCRPVEQRIGTDGFKVAPTQTWSWPTLSSRASTHCPTIQAAASSTGGSIGKRLTGQ